MNTRSGGDIAVTSRCKKEESCVLKMAVREEVAGREAVSEEVSGRVH